MTRCSASGAAGAASTAITGTEAAAGAGTAAAGATTGAGAGAGVGTGTAAGTTAAGTAAAAAGSAATGAAPVALPLVTLTGLGSSGCSARTSPSRWALRRTRSACASSMLDEWLLTPIPRSMERSRASLLVRPSSRASSWTRIFGATCAFSLSYPWGCRRALARQQLSLSRPGRIPPLPLRQAAGAAHDRPSRAGGGPGRTRGGAAPVRRTPAKPGRATRHARGRCD